MVGVAISEIVLASVGTTTVALAEGYASGVALSRGAMLVENMDGGSSVVPWAGVEDIALREET